MAIVEADFDIFLSGGAGNADPNLSLGGVKSSTAWAGGTLHDLFDLISGDENAASNIEYRGIYVQNGHATLTMEALALYISAETAGGASIAIALADEAVNVTMETIADEDTAPVGPVFSSPTTRATGLLIGNLAPAAFKGVWIRRTAANTVALDNDGATLEFACDTAA